MAQTSGYLMAHTSAYSMTLKGLMRSMRAEYTREVVCLKLIFGGVHEVVLLGIERWIQKHIVPSKTMLTSTFRTSTIKNMHPPVQVQSNILPYKYNQIYIHIL